MMRIHYKIYSVCANRISSLHLICNDASEHYACQTSHSSALFFITPEHDEHKSGLDY